MTENTESPQKKANLIKQPKAFAATPEQLAATASPEESSGEKRKVVVVKKKLVVRKPQTRVVARREEGQESPALAAKPDDTAPAQGSVAAPARSSVAAEAASTQALQDQTAPSREDDGAAPVQSKAAPAARKGLGVSARTSVTRTSKKAADPAVSSSDTESSATAPARSSAAAPAGGSMAAPARSSMAAPARSSVAPAASTQALQDQAEALPEPTADAAAAAKSGDSVDTIEKQPSRSVLAAAADGAATDKAAPSNDEGAPYRPAPRSGDIRRSNGLGNSPRQSNYGSRSTEARSGAPGARQGHADARPGGYTGPGQGYTGYRQGDAGARSGAPGARPGGYADARPGGYTGPGQGYTGYRQGDAGARSGAPGARPGYTDARQGYADARPSYSGPRPGYSGPAGPRPGYSGPGGSRSGPPNARPGYADARPGYSGPRPGYSGPAGPRPGYSGPGGSRPGGYAGGRPGYAGPGGSGRGPGGASGPPMGIGKGLVRKAPVKRKGQFARREDEEAEKQLQLKKKAEARALAIPKNIDIMENISVSDLAKKMNIKPAELIGKLMGLGVMATINQKIDAETATILAAEYGCEVHIVSLYDETVIEKDADKPEDLLHRAPIVTVMGHVDHGKTKLLDAIRKTDVVAGEFGGITQHIGAYQVETPKGKITFLDTPGHAAFTKMRARGSQITDIVVLVVSAVEGVMPQTREAIDHAKAADVPIIVAVNKIDLPESNPDRVKTQLSEMGLIPEDWGGLTMFCEISALQKKGIPELLDAILLQAEVLELTANHDRYAEGKVIESRIDQGRGIVATVIVERGTLRIGDPFVAGIFPGKVRALFNDKGLRIDEASPSTPVEVLGFEGMPNAGDPFEVVEDEKYARAISDKRQELKKYEEGKNVKKVTLDTLYDTISAGETQELKVVIKGDVQGSVEALKNLLEKLSTREVRLNVIRAAAGVISEDDVMMASASDAIIIGFNVRPSPAARQLAEREKVDIRKYNVIYKAQEEIQKAMEGMLAPELKEQEIGKAEVRDTFKVPKIGIIAGSYVLEGLVRRTSQIRVVRDDVEIFQGKVSSLKRFKDDAKEVVAGYECGIGIENCNDLKTGDILEVYETIEIARSLGQTLEQIEKASKAEKADKSNG